MIKPLMWYDTTGPVQTGQTIELFNNCNLGQRELSNMLSDGQPGGHEYWIINDIRLRLLHKNRDEEAMLIDFLTVSLILGDSPQEILPGSLLLETNPRTFIRPIIVPSRQIFRVKVFHWSRGSAAPLNARVTMFGWRNEEAAK